jgi:hypothetical protein
VNYPQLNSPIIAFRYAVDEVEYMFLDPDRGIGLIPIIRFEA